MKKTIIALAAASSVALSHGVAVAQEPIKDDKVAASSAQEGKKNPSAKGSSSAQDFFGWEDGTTPKLNKDGKQIIVDGKPQFEKATSTWEKFKDVAAVIAGVVTLLGSISALFANIEKIAKQFSNFGK